MARFTLLKPVNSGTIDHFLFRGSLMERLNCRRILIGWTKTVPSAAHISGRPPCFIE